MGAPATGCGGRGPFGPAAPGYIGRKLHLSRSWPLLRPQKRRRPTTRPQVVNERRKAAVDTFQTDDSCRAALLSITAAGVRAAVRRAGWGVAEQGHSPPDTPASGLHCVHGCSLSPADTVKQGFACCVANL